MFQNQTTMQLCLPCNAQVVSLVILDHDLNSFTCNIYLTKLGGQRSQELKNNNNTHTKKNTYKKTQKTNNKRSLAMIISYMHF